MFRAMRSALPALLAALAVLSPFAPAMAQGRPPATAPAASKPAAKSEPQKLGSFTGWDAFTYAEGRNKICYVIGRPKTSEPKGAKRDEIYLTVTHRTADKVKGEFGVYFGYPLKDKSNVEAAIGNAKFSLFSHEDSAYAMDAKTEQALTTAMGAGQSLLVRGTSARNTATTDTYALPGFAAALKAIDAACK